MISISKSGKKRYDLKLSSVKEICEMLDYDYLSSESNKSYKALGREMKLDKLNRIKRGYKTGIKYPLQINK